MSDQIVEAVEETPEAPEMKQVDVYVLLPDELEALAGAVSELPIKLGNGIYQGLQAVANRGTVKINVQG